MALSFTDKKFNLVLNLQPSCVNKKYGTLDIKNCKASQNKVYQASDSIVNEIPYFNIKQ
jgi:hypothetical protein